MKPCFGKEHIKSAKECQLCSDATKCEMTTGSCSIKWTGKLIAVVQILNARKQATSDEIKKDMFTRFEKDLNVYYYIQQLKEYGLIDVHITGRKRLYYLRQP